jgi:hypothetical protein
MSTETPIETVLRAAGARRVRADGPFLKKRDIPAVLATAELLEAVAAEMGQYARVEARDGVVGVVEFLGGAFRPSATWTAAYKLARAVLGD